MSIRRLRKFEIEDTLRKRNINPDTHHADRTKACLKFVATIPSPGGGSIEQSVLSKPLQCMTEPGAPEILLVSPNTGSPKGDYLITLVGRKFKSGFKVRFFAKHDNETWEVWANVNRDMSNQGAAVVTVPQFVKTQLMQPVTVNIEVKIGPEREPYISEPAEFTFTPPPESMCSVCQNCRSLPTSPIQQTASVGVPSPAGSCYSNSSVYTPCDADVCPSPIDSLLSDTLFDSAFVSAATSPAETSNFSDISFDEFLGSRTPSVASTSGLSASHRPSFDFSTNDWWQGDQAVLPTDCAYPEPDKEEAWKNIRRVIEELASSSITPAGRILQFLDILAETKDALLLKIYQRCHTTAQSIPGAQPSVLMRDELSTYLQAVAVVR